MLSRQSAMGSASLSGQPMSLTKATVCVPLLSLIEGDLEQALGLPVCSPYTLIWHMERDRPDRPNLLKTKPRWGRSLPVY